MKFASIDIETTGLSPENSDILQFAVVLDDLKNSRPLEELPRFQAIFMQDNYKGNPFALSMHSEIFKKIDMAKKKNLEYCPDQEIHFMPIDHLPTALAAFFLKNGYNQNDKNGNIYINPAGKNLSSFDYKDWDDSTTQRVMSVIRNSVPEGRLVNEVIGGVSSAPSTPSNNSYTSPVQSYTTQQDPAPRSQATSEQISDFSSFYNEASNTKSSSDNTPDSSPNTSGGISSLDDLYADL